MLERRILISTLLVMLGAWDFLGVSQCTAQENHILDSIIANPDADDASIVAAERTLEIIERLAKESLEDSFENLSHVDDFYDPGFHPGSAVPTAYDRYTQVLLSNRRIAKLYSELLELDGDSQYELLSKYLAHYQKAYGEIIEKFHVSRTATYDDKAALMSIRQAQVTSKHTLPGTRHALRSIALLSGMLGNAGMWPPLKEAFGHSTFVVPIDEAQYKPSVVALLRAAPVFPPGFQAQVLFLMSRYADDTSAASAGFPKSAVVQAMADFAKSIDERAAAGDRHALRVKEHPVALEVKIADYRTEITSYDVLYTAFGYSVDASRASLDVEFLVGGDWDLPGLIVKAAGLAYSDDDIMK